jgi:hypothetical protein
MSATKRLVSNAPARAVLANLALALLFHLRGGAGAGAPAPQYALARAMEWTGHDENAKILYAKTLVAAEKIILRAEAAAVDTAAGGAATANLRVAVDAYGGAGLRAHGCGFPVQPCHCHAVTATGAALAAAAATRAAAAAEASLTRRVAAAAAHNLALLLDEEGHVQLAAALRDKFVPAVEPAAVAMVTATTAVAAARTGRSDRGQAMKDEDD